MKTDRCINRDYGLAICKEEAASALAAFHAGPLSWLNKNLEMLICAEGGKPKNLGKKP